MPLLLDMNGLIAMIKGSVDSWEPINFEKRFQNPLNSRCYRWNAEIMEKDAAAAI